MTFKKFIVGLAIFVLTIIFIAFVNEAINPKPTTCYAPGVMYNQSAPSYGSMSTCDYSTKLHDYKARSFVIMTVLSVLALVAGVLVRSVKPISWGLSLAGIVMIFYIFIASYDEIGKPYRAIVSGLALAVLIWLSYVKLGDKQQLNSQDVKPTEPQAPISDQV
ncbi:MAG: hypothetical protein HW405_486 [Candidatus Berkelbacteria bacterium]|nr:hypothetical protein [Candidatus Berkelbacteria bacterium]